MHGCTRSIGLALTVCSILLTNSVSAKETHPEYALYFDGNGYPLAALPPNDPCADKHQKAPGGWQVIRDDDEGQCWQQYESKILDGVRASGKRVLVFVHGGLNSLNDGRARVDKLIQLGGKTEGTLLHDYYPIFINWRASLFNSYIDHLANIRQGVRQPTLAKFTLPYVLIKDIVVGGIKTVPDTAEVVSDSLPELQPKRIVCFVPPSQPIAYRLQKDPNCNDGLDHIDYRWGQDWRSSGERTTNYLKQVPFLLIKPLSTGFIIDGFGSESWQVMLRRTDLIFHHEDSPSTSVKSWDSRTLTAFLEKLKEVVAASDQHTFDFVAHSAGTIILNRALREVPDLPISNIVYMAAATTMEDYENVVLGDGINTGFLTRHPDTQVFHLLLHPTAEIQENDLGFFEIQPRGSLLYWIDTFLTEPQYLRQRTLGRADNLTARIEATPASLRPRLHMKIFDYGGADRPNPKDWYVWCLSHHQDCQPQRHGDFGSSPFWAPWFWEPHG